MGIANRILNILVLVAAIAAGVCSYMLFQKRDQLTKGRQMMAEAIAAAAKKADPSAPLAANEMDVKKTPAQLKNPLAKLSAAVDALLNQRNILASEIVQISDMVAQAKPDLNKLNEAPAPASAAPAAPAAEGEAASAAPAAEGEAVPAAPAAEGEAVPAAPAEPSALAGLQDFNQSVATANSIKARIQEKLQYYQDRNAAFAANIKKIASILSQPQMNDDDLLKNDKLSSYVDTLVARTRTILKRSNMLSAHVLAVSEKLQKEQVRVGVDTDDNEMGKAFEKQLADIQEILDKCDKLTKDLEEANAMIDEMTSKAKTTDELQKTLNAKNADLAILLKKSQDEVARLKKIIDPTGDGESGQSTDNKVDLNIPFLRSMVGKVLYVSQEYGFVVINLGTKSMITREINGTKKNIMCALPNDSLLTVATSLDPDKAQYIGKLQVTKVGENTSVANLIMIPGTAAPKVGDIVFFAETDLNQMKALRDEARRKALEEAALAAQKKAEADALAAAKAEAENKKNGKSDAEESEDAEEESMDEEEAED